MRVKRQFGGVLRAFVDALDRLGRTFQKQFHKFADDADTAGRRHSMKRGENSFIEHLLIRARQRAS